MATYIGGSTTFDHTSDDGYRAWVAAIISALAAVNPSIFSQTSDTGQIDTSTVARPGSNSVSPYFIFKLNDGIGPPLYIKFYVGTGLNITQLGMKIEVGTGTNGAGVITGKLYIDPSIVYGPTTSQTGPIMLSVVPGSLTLCFGQASVNNGVIGTFVNLQRSTDSSGNFNGEGICGVRASYQGAQCYGFSSDIAGISRNSATSYGNFAAPVTLYSKATMVVDGNVKPMPIFYMSPDVRVQAGACILITSDIGLNTEFSVAMVGATPRNFKYTGAYTGNAAFCTIWE